MREFSRKLLFHSYLMGFLSVCTTMLLSGKAYILIICLHDSRPACSLRDLLSKAPCCLSGQNPLPKFLPPSLIPFISLFFSFCSLSQNLTYINSWKSSSSRVGSVSFHQQFNLLCWQTESTCTQGPRKNRHFLPQSATNEFTEQCTKQCSVTNHQPTC